MKILVTGASGYIGQKLALALAAQQNHVVALVRSTAANESLRHPNIQICIGDINDPLAVAAAMAGCRQVYHVAGYARLWAPDSAIFYRINVDGTRIVLHAALEENIQKLVYTSSTAVFGPSLSQPIIESDPRTIAFDNDYDLSKHLAELEVHKYIQLGLPAVIVNPSRVFGPGLPSQSNVFRSMLKKAIQKSLILLPGKTSVIGNYAYIDDVVNGHINAMLMGGCGERYILGGENKSIQDLIDTVACFTGPFPTISIPGPILKFLVNCSLAYKKIAGQDAAYSASGISRYARDSAFDCSKAITMLHYNITPFTIGIENTIHEIKNEIIWLTKLSRL